MIRKMVQPQFKETTIQYVACEILQTVTLTLVSKYGDLEKGLEEKSSAGK